MAVPVVVVPRLLVLVAAVPGRDPLQSRRDVVVDETRLVLDRGERRGRAVDQERRLSGGHTRLGDGPLHLLGQVDDVVVPARAALERVVLCDHVESPVSQSSRYPHR